MKTFQISINGKSEHIIELNDNEAVTIHVQNNPRAEPPFPKTSIRANGGRWENQEYYQLEWQERPLEIGDSISITYSQSSTKPTGLLKCEKYIKPEEECIYYQMNTNAILRNMGSRVDWKLSTNSNNLEG